MISIWIKFLVSAHIFSMVYNNNNWFICLAWYQYLYWNYTLKWTTLISGSRNWRRVAISCSRNHRNGELYSLIEKCCYFWIQKSSSTNISWQFICYWTPCTCKTFIQFQEFIIKSIVQLWNDDSTWSFNGIVITPFMGCIVQRYGYMIAFFFFSK